MRLLVVLLSLLVAAFCVVGLMATAEPIDATTRLTWRLVYGLGLAASLWMLVGALRRRED
jgi:hypothetical protein